MKSTYELKGFGKFEKQLEALPKKVSSKISATAIIAGLKVASKAIIAISPPMVARSIGYRLARKRRQHIKTGLVGVNVGHGHYTGTQWAAAMVSGTVWRFRHTKAGVLVSTGRIVGNDAVNKGISSAQAEIAETIKSVVASELEKVS